jgi:NADPH-dependent ferric siderophore reductase
VTADLRTLRLVAAGHLSPRVARITREALDDPARRIAHHAKLIQIASRGPDPEVAVALLLRALHDLPAAVASIERAITLRLRSPK